MSDRERHIAQLFTAELQFRLASAVRLATTRNVQPLDLPTEWTHGQHRVKSRASSVTLLPMPRSRRCGRSILTAATRSLPFPISFGTVIHQIGELILTKVDEIPAGAVRVDVERLPDGGIPLPGGYVVRPIRKE